MSHMFGGGGAAGAPPGGGSDNAPMMSNQYGANPAAAGYGPPPDQETGHGQMGGPGPNFGGPPMMGGGPPMMGGQQPGYNYAPVGGAPPAGAGVGMPPGGYPGAGQPGPPGVPTPPAYTRMSSTNPMNLIWFAAACSIMFGSLISFFSEICTLEWIDALEMCYLFIFSLLLAILDTPLFNQVAIVSELRTAIGKYIAVLQRVTGKGAAYIFLGCALWSSMFANLEGGFLLFLAVLIGLFVVIIGCLTLAIAILKSRNLDLVRKELRKDHSTLKQMYDMHAKMNPAAGITQEEFKKMTPYARGVSFEQGDIKLIFNALSTHPRRDVISLDDLTAWVNGNMMVFI